MLACGDTDKSANIEQDKIVIAGKPMTEQYVLVELLSQLIEAHTNLLVEKKQGIGGGTSNIHPAMLKGEIDIYPEYTGTAWLFVLKEKIINNPKQLYRAVREKYKQNYSIKWSGLYGFNDTFALAIKRDVAHKYGIKTYSDLAKYKQEIRFGAEYDFYEREDGYPGLKSVYGIDFENTSEMDIGLKYQAVLSDQVDAINVFSTDAKLKELDLLVLEDDKNFFPSYYAASLVRAEVLEEHPELTAILELLTNKINNTEMIEMNYQVEVEKIAPKDVASKFLKAKGLIK